MIKGFIFATLIIFPFHQCKINDSFPDKICTPGQVSTATKQDICTKGYTKKVRNVPISLKNKVYKEYGVKSYEIGQYEIDHFIPLELGGSNDIKNLFPEAANPKPGFHEKDRVENYLHREVCAGRITLKEAQDGIIKDWTFYIKSANKLKK